MKSTPSEIEQCFASTLEAQLEFYPDAKDIIVAFSGGADSTVLLYLFSLFQKRFSLNIQAAYIHHGIRRKSETDPEDRQVRQSASRFGIPLYEKHYDPGFIQYYAALKKCGIESAARDYRYHYFKKLQNKIARPSLLALGHNRNDQEETILMRLFSSSGVESLKGIPKASEAKIRPLMDIKRQDIEAYLQEKKIRYCEDASNQERLYLRNKVRLDVIPAIHTVFPSAQDSLLSLSSDLGTILDHYHSLIQDCCPWDEEEDQMSCSVDDFFELPFVSRKNQILEKINKLLKNKVTHLRIPSAFLSPLVNKPKGRVVLEGYGIRFYCQKNRLILVELDESDWDSQSYRIDKNNPYHSEPFSLKLMDLNELNSQDHVLFNLISNEPLILTREAKQNHPHSGKEDKLIFRQGGEVLFTIKNSKNFRVGKFKSKKKSLNDSTSKQLCVIIEYRGGYAPGRQ